MKLQKIKRKLLKIKAKVNISLSDLEIEILKLKSKKLDYIEFIKSVSALTEKYIKPLNKLLDRFNDKSWYIQYRLVSSSIHKSIYQDCSDKEMAWEVYNLFYDTCTEIINASSKMSKIITPFLSLRAF